MYLPLADLSLITVIEDGKPDTVLKFAANALHGTLQNPLIIEGGDILQQSIQLHAVLASGNSS